mmetsp:Transcript_48743/g.111805  ORF Transcript_48743/g.111805 Transcript_48743/m.111805 type:complete len:81 (-) Transcript_48743:226-468(-)
MVAREVPALASLCLASVARHPTRALGRVRALPVDRRCFEQLMAALKGDTHVTDELLLLLLRRSHRSRGPVCRHAGSGGLG